MTTLAVQSFTSSSQPPLSIVVNPTHDEKSSRMCAKQWSLKRLGAHTPPASERAVCPPAEPPKTPTASRRRNRDSFGSLAIRSIAWLTSSGRLFQLAGPGSEKSR
jgi:hypothetical protein